MTVNSIHRMACVHAIVFIGQIYEFYEFTPWKMVKYYTWIFITVLFIAHVYDELENDVPENSVVQMNGIW